MTIYAPLPQCTALLSNTGGGAIRSPARFIGNSAQVPGDRLGRSKNASLNNFFQRPLPNPGCRGQAARARPHRSAGLIASCSITREPCVSTPNTCSAVNARDRFSARQPSQGASSPLLTGSLNSAVGAAGSCHQAQQVGAQPLRRDAHLQVHHLAASCRPVPPTSRASWPWRPPDAWSPSRASAPPRSAPAGRSSQPAHPSDRADWSARWRARKPLAGPRMSITVVDASGVVPVRPTRPSSRT